jgi:uridylate kinase
MSDDLKFKRILLKLSGEALMGDKGHGIDPSMIDRVTDELLTANDAGYEIAVVIGGGNIYRGISGAAAGMDRAACDYMGMMATVINAIALQETLIRKGHKPELTCAFDIGGIVDEYERRDSQYALGEGRIVILSGGTGRPFFTTDTAAAIRALELGCDVVVKASHVDGVYDKDPNKHTDAKRYDEISFAKAIEQKLEVVDQTAFSLCWENKIPLIVFDVRTPGNLQKVLGGDTSVGTLVR